MIPDKDQVREALAAYDRWSETVDCYGWWVDMAPAVAVARAFVDGELLPAKPDYEAAQSLLDDILLNLLPDGQGMAIDAAFIVDAALPEHSEASLNDRPKPDYEAAARSAQLYACSDDEAMEIARRIVDAALAGEQETGDSGPAA